MRTWLLTACLVIFAGRGVVAAVEVDTTLPVVSTGRIVDSPPNTISDGIREYLSGPNFNLADGSTYDFKFVAPSGYAIELNPAFPTLYADLQLNDNWTTSSGSAVLNLTAGVLSFTGQNISSINSPLEYIEIFNNGQTIGSDVNNNFNTNQIDVSKLLIDATKPGYITSFDYSFTVPSTSINTPPVVPDSNYLQLVSTYAGFDSTKFSAPVQLSFVAVPEPGILGVLLMACPVLFRRARGNTNETSDFQNGTKIGQ